MSFAGGATGSGRGEGGEGGDDKLHGGWKVGREEEYRDTTVCSFTIGLELEIVREREFGCSFDASTDVLHPLVEIATSDFLLKPIHSVVARTWDSLALSVTVANPFCHT
jgi:hypothetical protein